MKRLLQRVISVLSWATVLVLGAFGVFFWYANYPVLGIAVTLSIVLLIGYWERKRRQRHRAAEQARRERRARSQEPLT